ncbi:B12-binding domain-containing protein [Streptomyces virginiae]|uniref:cobalamin B12-binding domain-containing protein n=1 Tax=Streptomyces virginiae TaxID=1961 RepID=UPI0036BF9EE7
MRAHSIGTSRIPPVERSTQRLWEAAVACDEAVAVSAVREVLDAGREPEQVLLDMIAVVQGRVGEEWAADRINVAQEHAATAVDEPAAGTVAHPPASFTKPFRGRITVACVDGEWHALPARLLAEVLELRGWNVDHLGAQVPTHHLVAHLRRTGPEAVALSSSIATRMLGADAWASDARSAAEHMNRGPLEVTRPDRQAIDDLPHLDDQEYTFVTRNRTQLVGAVLTALEDVDPAVRNYGQAQRERTAEGFCHTTLVLGVALYTGDETLFTDFLLWTADILAARGVPARPLPPALAALGRQLEDLPRATAMLRTGTTHLTSAPVRNSR